MARGVKKFGCPLVVKGAPYFGALLAWDSGEFQIRKVSGFPDLRRLRDRDRAIADEIAGGEIVRRARKKTTSAFVEVGIPNISGALPCAQQGWDPQIFPQFFLEIFPSAHRHFLFFIFLFAAEAAGARMVGAAPDSGQRDPTHAGYPAECDRSDGGDWYHRARP